MTAFAETPQGKSLMRQVENASSNWLHSELLNVYRKARDHYESTIPHSVAWSTTECFNNDLKEKTMSLEQALAANTAAIEALTAALAGAKVSGASTEKPAAEKPAAEKTAAKAKAKPAAPVHTRDELAAVLTELKEKSGSTEAPREIIKSVGAAEKSKDIAEDKIDAVYDAVKAALVALEEEDV